MCSDQRPQPLYPPEWLNRFLMGLAALATIICISMWAYNLYGRYFVLDPALVILQSGADDQLSEAVRLMESPHIFAGYEPYHDFGTDKAAKTHQQVKGLMALGRDYSDREMRRFSHRIAHYLPAYIELKVEGTVPVVSKDRYVLLSLYDRWDNAVRSGFIFSTYMTLVAAILTTVFLVYRRKKLWEKLGPPVTS